MRATYKRHPYAFVLLYIACAIGVCLIVFSAISASFVRAEQKKFQVLEYSFDINDCAITQPDCSIDMTVHNPTSQTLRPQYINTSSAGLNVVIYDADGESCTGKSRALGASYIHELQPKETAQGTLTCTSMDNHHHMGSATRVIIYGKGYSL